MTQSREWYPVMVPAPNRTKGERIIQGMYTRGEDLGDICQPQWSTCDYKSTPRKYIALWTCLNYSLWRVYLKILLIKMCNFPFMLNYANSMPACTLRFTTGGIICPKRHFDLQIPKYQRSLMPSCSKSRLLNVFYCGTARLLELYSL